MATGIMGESQELDAEEQAWYDRFQSLNKKCTDMETFDYEGVLYHGSSVHAIKRFIENNPQPADFHVWLTDNWEKVTI